MSGGHTSGPALFREVRALAAEAAEWRLLSLLLGRPRPGWHEEVAALSSEVADPELREAAAAAAGAGEGRYHALFGPGGPISPREVGHRGWADPGRLLAEVQAHYQAFGFAPRAEEPADHVAVEADFLAYLRVKEAWALSRGDGEAAAVTREARERFAGEHLAPLARGLAEKLAGGTDHAARAARTLGARVAHLAAEAPVAAQDPLGAGCPMAAPDCETDAPDCETDGPRGSRPGGA